MSIGGSQCRLARTLLGWSQKDLAAETQIGLRSLIDFENGAKPLKPPLMVALEKAFSDHGVVWIDEPDWVGVKIRRTMLAPRRVPEK
jgi:transcriptional regulator with XRE-family HTH domain